MTKKLKLILFLYLSIITAQAQMETNQPIILPSSAEPALGIPVPEMVFLSDARAYMKQVIKAPADPGYLLPNYAIEASNYDEAVFGCNERYPEFAGLEGEELVKAAWAYPLRYQEMIKEASALRDRFYPGWRELRVWGDE